MAEENVRLTPVGKMLSILLIAALIAGGAYIVLRKTGKPAADGPEALKPEAPDLSKLTAKEYTYKPMEKLPPVKGVSQYEWDASKTLRFSYNVWSGWLPVIAANHGTKANDESIFFKKYGFHVELMLMDDPVVARDAFTAGKVHTLWGTVDMLTLFAPELARDSRTNPRVFQQIDWSSGGDGIVVRSNIKSVADLRGKTITLAQNSPSEYYLTNLLISAGMKPSDVNAKYTGSAFEAATAFVSDKTNAVDACVSWAPDIYTITNNVAGTRLLSTTAVANKLIADVYAFRADFAKDHPEVVKGLVAGIFEGMDLVKQDPQQSAKWMAEAFGMKTEDVLGMMGDAHPTNFAENLEFFCNASNPTNFERTWKNASYVYRQLRRIEAPVAFDQVMDFTVLKELQAEGRFADQKDESVVSFKPSDLATIQAEKPVLTQTIHINFYPNSANPYEVARDDLGNPVPGKLYDPSVDATMERVSLLSAQFGKAVILVQGHSDSSMKGKVPVQAVRDLSLARAEAIKRALLEKFKGFDPNKFTVEGKGWDVPANPEDPLNQALNRRVEISVYPPEQQ